MAEQNYEKTPGFGTCRMGIYKSNVVVTHFPLVCFGGHGQPRCEHLDTCAAENGMVKRKRRKEKENG